MRRAPASPDVRAQLPTAWGTPHAPEAGAGRRPQLRHRPRAPASLHAPAVHPRSARLERFNLFWQNVSVTLPVNSTLSFASSESCLAARADALPALPAPGRPTHLDAPFQSSANGGALASRCFMVHGGMHPTVSTTITPPPPPAPPPAGAHIYGGVDWVAMAMSADETAGGPAGQGPCSAAPFLLWESRVLHLRAASRIGATSWAQLPPAALRKHAPSPRHTSAVPGTLRTCGAGAFPQALPVGMPLPAGKPRPLAGRNAHPPRDRPPPAPPPRADLRDPASWTLSPGVGNPASLYSNEMRELFDAAFRGDAEVCQTKGARGSRDGPPQRGLAPLHPWGGRACGRLHPFRGSPQRVEASGPSVTCRALPCARLPQPLPRARLVPQVRKSIIGFDVPGLDTSRCGGRRRGRRTQRGQRAPRLWMHACMPACLWMHAWLGCCAKAGAVCMQPRALARCATPCRCMPARPAPGPLCSAWEAGFGSLYWMEGVLTRQRDRRGGARCDGPAQCMPQPSPARIFTRPVSQTAAAVCLPVGAAQLVRDNPKRQSGPSLPPWHSTLLQPTASSCPSCA